MTSVTAGRSYNATMGTTAVAKRKLHGRELPTSWPITAVLLTATCVTGIEPAKAAIDLAAAATVGYEHDTNPFELNNANAQTFIDDGTIKTQDDWVRRLTGIVTAENGATGPTHFELQAKYGNVDNKRFDGLDHTEYNLGGNLDWKPSQAFDTTLQASHIRVPISLNNARGGQVVQRTVQQTTTQAEGTLRIRPVPTWQISLTPRWFINKIPLQNPANFELEESSGTVGLGYLGAGPLIPGIFAAQSRGEFSGIVNATRYTQRTYGVTLNYKVTDFSTFALVAGRTERTTRLIVPSNTPQALALEGKQPAFTGSLTFHRQLSVKTGIDISAFRDFQQYDVGTNTQVSTGFNFGVNWDTTAKLSVILNAQLVRSTIEGLQLAGTDDERTDLERNFSVSTKYLVTNRLSLRPYFMRRLHNSTFRSAVFNKSMVGLDLTVSID